MIDSDVTLLPQPDSPTMPSVRPASTAKLTPSTAVTSRPSTVKVRAQAAHVEQRRHRRAFARSILKACDAFLDHGPVSNARGIRVRRQARHERLEPLEALLVEAPELGEWALVVVDAQVEARVVLGRRDQDRRGLAAALVAAGRIAGLERGEQALRERQRRSRVRRLPAVSASTCGPTSMLPATL